ISHLRAAPPPLRNAREEHMKVRNAPHEPARRAIVRDHPVLYS
ncbi:hypothetical protein A2U01_0115369, partial [Trifolium medium]|nr:hypothetical protein [Trifolium medium]